MLIIEDGEKMDITYLVLLIICVNVCLWVLKEIVKNKTLMIGALIFIGYFYVNGKIDIDKILDYIYSLL